MTKLHLHTLLQAVLYDGIFSTCLMRIERRVRPQFVDTLFIVRRAHALIQH